mgnify:CR=1 FL=1
MCEIKLSFQNTSFHQNPTKIDGVTRRDWSRVRKWDRVRTRELLGPTGTGTVNFHREHKVGSLAYDGQNIPPYRHV